MKTVESGEIAYFPLPQTVEGIEYIPDSGSLTVRDRTGKVTHHLDEIDVSKPLIELPAVTTEIEDHRWVTLTFVTGSQVLRSRWHYRILPFMATTFTNEQVRRLLTVSAETLPDEFIDLFNQYAELKTRYPNIEDGQLLDEVVVISEALRLLNSTEVWLLQSRAVEDAKETRFKFNSDALRSELMGKLVDKMETLVPDFGGTTPPTLLQFAPITDAFSGES